MKKKKVLIYLTRDNGTDQELLVFKHRDFPEAGIQVPAGSVNETEPLEGAARREVFEESGLTISGHMDYLATIDYFRADISQHQLKNIFHHHFNTRQMDAWTHLVSGRGEDSKLFFYFFWHTLSIGEGELASDQGRYLPLIRPAALRELCFAFWRIFVYETFYLAIIPALSQSICYRKVCWVNGWARLIILDLR